MGDPKQRMAYALATSSCVFGAIFAFTQGSTAPAELSRMQSAGAQRNNEELQKMLDGVANYASECDIPYPVLTTHIMVGLKHKTTGEKLQDAMDAMKNMHEIKAYMFVKQLKGEAKPESPPTK
eukprot:1417030-Rhodomonas_salina.1